VIGGMAVIQAGFPRATAPARSRRAAPLPCHRPLSDDYFFPSFFFAALLLTSIGVIIVSSSSA